MSQSYAETQDPATENTATEAKGKGGNISQQAIYNKINSRSQEVLDALFEGLASNNEAIKIGAAKTLLNKILPDLKVTEVHGGLNEDGTRRPFELLVNLGGGFIPASLSVSPSPASSTPTESSTVQSSDLASESEKDLHSDNGNSQTGSC